MPTQEILNQLLTFVSLYQHANNQPNSQICSVDTVDLQILQSDWLSAFRIITPKQEFSQIEFQTDYQEIKKKIIYNYF